MSGCGRGRSWQRARREHDFRVLDRPRSSGTRAANAPCMALAQLTEKQLSPAPSIPPRPPPRLTLMNGERSLDQALVAQALQGGREGKRAEEALYLKYRGAVSRIAASFNDSRRRRSPGRGAGVLRPRLPRAGLAQGLRLLLGLAVHHRPQPRAQLPDRARDPPQGGRGRHPRVAAGLRFRARPRPTNWSARLRCARSAA